MNLIEKMLSAFGRRNVANKTHGNRTQGRRVKLKNGNRLKRRGNPRIKVRSGLGIKLRGDESHVRARLYKRLFRGVSGAHSWKTLDKIFKPAKRESVVDRVMRAGRKLIKATPPPLPQS